MRHELYHEWMAQQHLCRFIVLVIFVLIAWACGAGIDSNLFAGVPAEGYASTTSGSNGMPDYSDPGEKGPYAVGFQRLAFVDSSRGTGSAAGGRPISVFLWYPADARDINTSTPKATYALDPLYDEYPVASSSDFEALGLDTAYQMPPPSKDKPFPLVMFSPGWTQSATQYIFVGTRLASHGFVVAVLTHDGEGTSPAASFDHAMVAVMNRPRDVSFALTQIIVKNESSGDLLYRLIREDQVVASGHSFGGYTALALAAGDDNVCDDNYGFVGWMGDPPPEACVQTSPDKRISAVVHLDGTNDLLKFAELSRIEVPTIGIGEGQDGLAFPYPMLPWNARPHAAISARESYRVDLNHTIHTSYTNICQSAPVWHQYGILGEADLEWYLAEFCNSPNPELWGGDLRPPLESQRLATEYMIAFLKTHIIGNEHYKAILKPKWVDAQHADIELFFTERGGDTYAGPTEQSNYLDPAWGEQFWYFAHQPPFSRH